MISRVQFVTSMALLGTTGPAMAGSGSPPGTIILFMTGVGVGFGLGLLLCWLRCKKDKKHDRTEQK